MYEEDVPALSTVMAGNTYLSDQKDVTVAMMRWSCRQGEAEEFGGSVAVESLTVTRGKSSASHLPLSGEI